MQMSTLVCYQRMSSVRIVTFIVVLEVILNYISSANGVKPVAVYISPQHIHFKYNSEEKITCKASEPISACEFRVFDLTDGNLTPLVLDGRQTMRSLPNGRCGLTLKASQCNMDSYYMVTCRVRSSNSDWSYASMSVYKSESDQFSVIVSRPEVTAMPGSSLNVATRRNHTGGRLTSCEWKRQRDVGFSDLFRLGVDQTCATHPEYHAAEEGEGSCGQTCGVAINGVAEGDNGILVFRLQTAHASEISLVTVIVAKAPITRLIHRTVENADGSMTLEANCTVIGGRPAPVLTWYLGDGLVPDEAVRSVVYKEWAWPFQEQKVKQRMHIELDSSHVGKEVRCSVTHVAMNVTSDEKFEMRRDGDAVPWLFLIIGILCALILMFLVIVIVYAWRKKLWCFSRSKAEEEASVKYRQSLDTSLRYEEISVPPDKGTRFTISSMDRSSVVTGLEYAEIRVSMVQRCVDKVEADKTSGTLSQETGEKLYEPMRPNSLYHNFTETS